jgi:hypothetical protein
MKRLILIGLITGLFTSSLAQDNTAKWLIHFREYQKNWPQERVAVIFNQQKFAPGDTAFFKLYVVRDNDQLNVQKQIVEINLADAKRQSALKSLINVSDGIGANQLIIPTNTLPGIYLFTAQTQSMKNVSPPYFYKKEVKIVGKNSITRTLVKKLEVAVEGQHLIAGVENKVVIKSGVPKEAIDLMYGVEQINTTTTDEIGIGSFIFTPQVGKKYFVKFSSDTVPTKLPDVEKDGIKLSVSNESIVITAAPSASKRQEDFTLISISKGKIHFTKTLSLSSGEQTSISLDETKFPGGVTSLLLVDKSGALVANRDLFTDDNNSIRCEVATDKHDYDIRDRGFISVKLTNQNGEPIEGEFSASITNNALFNKTANNFVSDELNVFGSLDNNYTIDRSNDNWRASLDNILIFEPLKIPWKEIVLANQAEPTNSLANPRQKIGTVVFSDSGDPVPDRTQIIFYLQKSKWRYQTFTLNKGTVRLTLPELFEDDEFFFTAETEKGKEIPNISIDWMKDEMILPQAPFSKEQSAADPYGNYTVRKRLVDKSYGVSATIQQSTENISNKTFETLVNGADVVVNVEDFVSFGTMTEVIREIIPSLFYRSIGGKERIHVILPEPLMAQSSGDPLYVIDDVVTKNTDFFLSLKPSELLSVKIIKDAKKLARLNLLGKNGVVIVNTKKGNVRESMNAANLVNGLSKPLNFNNKLLANDKHTPIFRSTLYWNPSLQTSQNGTAQIEFNTTDDIGTFTIQIDGLSRDGKPFSSTKTIQVNAGIDR